MSSENKASPWLWPSYHRPLELARELVDLDVQVLEWKAEQLDKELGELKDELAKNREQIDKVTRSRFDGLVNKVKKPRK